MATNERIKWHTITVENRSNGWERGCATVLSDIFHFHPVHLFHFGN